MYTTFLKQITITASAKPVNIREFFVPGKRKHWWCPRLIDNDLFQRVLNEATTSDEPYASTESNILFLHKVSESSELGKIMDSIGDTLIDLSSVEGRKEARARLDALARLMMRQGRFPWGQLPRRLTIIFSAKLQDGTIVKIWVDWDEQSRYWRCVGNKVWYATEIETRLLSRRK